MFQHNARMSGLALVERVLVRTSGPSSHPLCSAIRQDRCNGSPMMRGNEPVDQRRKATEVDRNRCDRAVHRDHEPRFVVNAPQIGPRNVPGILRTHRSQGMLGDRNRKRRPEPPAEHLLDIVLPGRRPRQHHGRVLALNLRIGVMHRVAITIPGRLADIDEADDPIGSLVEPAGAERGSVAAFVHGREQAREHDAVRQHGRHHQDRPVAQIDQNAAATDRRKMTAQIGQTDQVAAARELLALLLVDNLRTDRPPFPGVSWGDLLERFPGTASGNELPTPGPARIMLPASQLDFAHFWRCGGIRFRPRRLVRRR